MARIKITLYQNRTIKVYFEGEISIPSGYDDLQKAALIAELMFTENTIRQIKKTGPLLQLNVPFETWVLIDGVKFLDTGAKGYIPDSSNQHISGPDKALKKFISALQHNRRFIISQSESDTKEENHGSEVEFGKSRNYGLKLLEATNEKIKFHVRNFKIRELLFDSGGQYIREISFEGRSVRTMYTDTQALMFCAGIKDNKANAIYNKYISDKLLTPQDFFLAHVFIMNSRETYGAEFVDYCLELPALPIGLRHVTEMFTFLGRIRSNRTRVIRLAFNRRSDFEVFLEEREQRVVVRNNGRTVGYIRRTGQIDFLDRVMRKIPVIRLFIDFAHNPERMIVYFGRMTGRCSFCSRPLSDSRSVKWGYGPICAQAYNLPHF